jgi:hypothetical protein
MQGRRPTLGFVKALADRRGAKAANRRKASLQKAAREMQLRDTDGGSIWRSGKGGGHQDRM